MPDLTSSSFAESFLEIQALAPHSPAVLQPQTPSDTIGQQRTPSDTTNRAPDTEVPVLSLI